MIRRSSCRWTSTQLKGVVALWNASSQSGLILDQSQASHVFSLVPSQHDGDDRHVRIGMTCSFTSRQQADGSFAAAEIKFDTPKRKMRQDSNESFVDPDPQWTLILTDDTTSATSFLGPHPKYDTRYLISSADLLVSDDAEHIDHSEMRVDAMLGINHPFTIAQRYIDGYSALFDTDDAALEKLRPPMSSGGDTESTLTAPLTDDVSSK